jgi:hypothetical protein
VLELGLQSLLYAAGMGALVWRLRCRAMQCGVVVSPQHLRFFGYAAEKDEPHITGVIG